MLVFNRIIRFLAKLMVASFLLLLISPIHPGLASESQTGTTSASSSWSFPIRFFQKSMSRADGDRCPMYPSCSQYAAKAFKRHGAIKGWILSCDRLLRCGHDEIRHSPKVRAKRKVRVFDPIEANTRWWREVHERK